METVLAPNRVEDVDDGGVAEQAAAAAGEELAGAGAAEGVAAWDEGRALSPGHAHTAATGQDVAGVGVAQEAARV